MSGKLAVLIPVYNGGGLLLESVHSCAAAGLHPDRYEILVVDNCSTDAAVDRLPTKGADGAGIRLFRNSSNLGRVGNWNRAVEIAREEGFTYAAFLFVGDRWLANGSLPETLDQMDATGAGFALSRFWIARADGKPIHLARRVSFRGRHLVIDGVRLVKEMLLSGTLPLAPMQANLYRLSSREPLRFDTARPEDTDIGATVRYLTRMTGPALLSAEPFFLWTAHSGRFYFTKDMWEFLGTIPVCLREAGAQVGAEVDWARAHAILFLHSVFTVIRLYRWTCWPGELTKALRMTFLAEGGARLRSALSVLFRKCFLKQSAVHLDA